MSHELVPVQQMMPAVSEKSGTDWFRTSTDAASLCKAIVVSTAKNIQGRKFVPVEGWQAIAIAHGCVASSGEVKRTEDGGFSAIGRVVRMDTGEEIATAEGYVGPDEPVWFGGQEKGRTYQKRADYAIRAMAQTRAISRACRSAFAHVVVMMNAGLSTTPAEEVPHDGFDDRPQQPARSSVPTKLKAAAAQVDHSTYTDKATGEIASPQTSDLLARIAACKTASEVLELRPEVAKLPKGSHERQIATETAKAMIEELSVPTPPPHADAMQGIMDMPSDPL